MAIDLLIGAIKAIVILLLVLNLSAVLLWFERKGSALIQDRVGANRAAIFGIGKRLGIAESRAPEHLDGRSAEALHQGRFRSRGRR